jgi:uncharacterized protein (TIGR03067 family)
VITVRDPSAIDDEKTAADMKTLQGSWVAVAEVGSNGAIFDAEALRERDRRLTISGNQVTMWRSLGKSRGAFAGEFKINAKTGHFDFIGKGPNGNSSEWIGIYEIKDDTWTLCHNMKTAKASVRPENFGPDEEGRIPSRHYVFKRAPAAEDGERPLARIISDLEEIAAHSSAANEVNNINAAIAILKKSVNDNKEFSKPDPGRNPGATTE